MPICPVRLTKPEADFGENAEGVSDRLLYSYRHELCPSAARCRPPLGTVARPCLLVGHTSPEQLPNNMVVEEEGDDSRGKE